MHPCPNGILQCLLLSLAIISTSVAEQTADCQEDTVCSLHINDAREGDMSMLQKDSLHFSARLPPDEDEEELRPETISDDQSGNPCTDHPGFPRHCGDGFCIAKKGPPCPANWYMQMRKATAPTNPSRNVVALTYCDKNFAFLWPTFMKCYEQALECSSDVHPEICGDKKPLLLDLGISKEPGEVGQHCSHDGMPAWMQSSKSSNGSRGTSLLQMDLTPENVPELLMINLAEQLAMGHDVLRLDADAFLLEDVMQWFDRFPDADIISSPDFVLRVDKSQWYHDEAYIQRHGLSKNDGNVSGKDPLRDWGFMMNTGLTYFRSNPLTQQLAERAALAIKTGRSKFEQTALNEELVDLNCTWSEPERLPSGGNNEQNWRSVVTTPMLGSCAQGLKVVILPFYSTTRHMSQASFLQNRAISIHPAGKDPETVEEIAAMCEKRRASRLR